MSRPVGTEKDVKYEARPERWSTLMYIWLGVNQKNTIGWRSMNKTPSRPVGTEKDVKYEARPKGSKHSLRCDQTRTD